MKLKSLFAGICIVMTIMFSPSSAWAEPGGGGPDPDPGTQVPFDGGISLLIAAGVGYAVKKRYDKRKESEMAAVKQK